MKQEGGGRIKVLIIEGSSEVVETVGLCFRLRWSGAEIISTELGKNGIEMVATEKPDIVILDVGLSDMDGFEVLRQIRSFSNVPLVILSERDGEMDKVKGLELGADDYVVKPFSHVELLARVKAVLRRSQITEHQEEEDLFITSKLKINFTRREVIKDGKIVKLTPTEYDILHLLVKNEGRVLTRRMLLEKVWGSEHTDAEDYLSVYMQRLRRKLEDDFTEPQMLITERGVGYKLVNPNGGLS